eukprot:jgi/Botrbrau1/3117/Bobra.0070s0091.1
MNTSLNPIFIFNLRKCWMLGRGEAVSPCERRAGGGKSEGPKKKKKKPILCVKKHRKWGRTREIPQMPDARKLRSCQSCGKTGRAGANLRKKTGKPIRCGIKLRMKC